MLEAAENKERHAEQDAELGAAAINRDGKIHNDTAKQRFNQKAPGKIPASNFGLGGLNQHSITNTKDKANKVARQKIAGENNHEPQWRNFVGKKKAALPSKEIGAQNTDTEQTEREKEGAERLANF